MDPKPNPASSPVSKSSPMYVDDEDTSTSTTEDNEDVETVKTASTAKKDSQGTSLHQASETEDASLGDDDEEDIDQYFNDLFPDRNRLDTVEEVTEPMSSFHESLPMDMDLAKMSGQPSSDFMNESLPHEMSSVARSPSRNSMTLSVTSREEFCSVSEVEVLASTWPAPIKSEAFKNDPVGDNNDFASEAANNACSSTKALETGVDESEENSLSISLPSEGSQKSSFQKAQLSDVRAGILKIFDDAEEASYVINEKHEFEKTEKMTSIKRPGTAKSFLPWSSDDQADGLTSPPPADNDSGIDGAQSRSSSSKDKVWSKIHRQLNRRFGGSTGSLSSASPTSEGDGLLKKSETLTKSTSFAQFTGDLDQSSNAEPQSVTIKELLAQLAKAEEDKENIAKEAYRRAMEIKTEADNRLEDAHICQMKQASLIERFKEKVLAYKEQEKATEKRLLEVNLIANESQSKLNQTTHVIESLEERLKNTEERHFAEVKALHDQNEKVTQANNVLKQQLEKSQSANEQLNKDLLRLTAQWEQFNKNCKPSGVAVSDLAKDCTSQEKVVGLWQEILDFRRQMTHIKMSTERDLVTIKGELMNTERKVTTACADVLSSAVQSKSGLNETQVQLERCKTERKGLKDKLDSLNNDVAHYKSKIYTLEESLKEEKSNAENFKEKNMHLTKTVHELEMEVSKLKQVEKQNIDLENSLLDISNLVEETENASDEVDLSLSNQNQHDTSGLGRGRGLGGERRRTRSASPSVTDMTVSTVQTTLHKKQLQIHELTNRLSTSSIKMKEYQKTALEKSESLASTVKLLEKERNMNDDLRLKLDEVTREKSSAFERLDNFNAKTVALEKTREEMQHELTTAAKEKSLLKDTHSRIIHDLKMARADIDRLEATNKSLTKENKERLNLISQLEKVGSSLREELLTTKEELRTNLQKVESLKKASEHTMVHEKSLTASNADVEDQYYKALKREDELEQTVAQLTKTQASAKAANQRLEDTIKKLTDEKLKLNLEANESRSQCQSFKDQLNVQERKLCQVESELKTMEELLAANQSTRETLEMDLRKAGQQREDLDNLLTSLTLQKDSLHDEVIHLRTEAEELRSHLEQISGSNAILNKEKNELSVRNEAMSKDIERFQRQICQLKTEKSNLVAEYEDLQHDLSDSESEVTGLNAKNAELESEKEKMINEIKSLKQMLEMELARADAEKVLLEEERDSSKESFERSIKKLKEELSETEKEAIKQQEALQKTLESEFKKKVEKIAKDNEDLVKKLNQEIDETLDKLNSTKKAHREELLLLENSKQQAVAMAQQESKITNERLNDNIEELEKINKELEKQHREAKARLDVDRASINELQVEIVKLRTCLNEKDEQLEGDKKSLSERLSKEREERLNAQAEVDVLNSKLKAALEKEAQLQHDLTETRQKLDECQMAKHQNSVNLSECEMKLEECKRQIQRLEQIKVSMTESLQQTEVEKQNLEAELQTEKSKSAHLDIQLFEAKRDISSQAIKITSLQGECNDLEEQIQYWQSRFDELTHEHQDLNIEFDKLKTQFQTSEDIKNQENVELHSLRMKISELESTKNVQEKELHSLKLALTSDTESLQQKIMTLTKTLEEVRVREKKLEDQRHNLEICLTNAQQEIKDLHVRLTGQDGRTGELFATMARLEGAKQDLESKIAGVASLLRQVRSSSNSRSRPSSPHSRSLRSSQSRRASSPFPPSSSSSSGIEIDFDQVKRDIRDLVGRIGLAIKERDEALHKATLFKKQYDELFQNSLITEDQLSASKKKSRGFEEQLRKLELQLAQSDANYAHQEELLSKRETELRQLSARLETTMSQVEVLRRENESGTNAEEVAGLLRQTFDKEKRQLQIQLNDLEDRIAQLQGLKRQLERENQRLSGDLLSSNQEVQDWKNKCKNLGDGVSMLEDKCNNLSVTVDNLNVQLEKSLKNENDLHDKVADLSQSLGRKDAKSYETEERVGQLERNLERSKAENSALHDQLEVLQAAMQESKQRIFSLQRDVEDTESALQKSETKANHLELSLNASKASLENNVSDNYLREELTKLRRDNENLHDSLKEMTKKMSRLESDKRELEKKLTTRPPNAVAKSSAHVRSQIPLTGGKSPVSSGHHAHGENMVKIRMLEQENERLLRKLRGLEQQLSELEVLHGKRVQELLQERRREREKEANRQKDIFKHLEHSQSTREKIFKERVYSLEQQVEHLKEQLSKEMKRRQTFIMESSGIANEISELRHNLDQSLSAVNASTNGRTLDQEAGRLNHSVQSFGPDYASRLTPSKLRSGSTSTPKYRRNLHFDEN